MSARDAKAYQSFHEVTQRLDQIVSDVRSKNTSLEKSLDLFDEAIGLGSRAVDLVDRTDFSPEEKERLVELGTHKAEEAQERQAGNVAEELLEERGAQSVADGTGMGVPGHPEGETSADQALVQAMEDADDGAWSPDRPASR